MTVSHSRGLITFMLHTTSPLLELQFQELRALSEEKLTVACTPRWGSLFGSPGQRFRHSIVDEMVSNLYGKHKTQTCKPAGQLKTVIKPQTNSMTLGNCRTYQASASPLLKVDYYCQPYASIEDLISSSENWKCGRIWLAFYATKRLQHSALWKAREVARN